MASDVLIEDGAVGPVVRPPDPGETVILYLHGDRYLAGDPESALDMARSLALRTRATVVCSRYRPAFLTAIEDVHSAYRHCQDSGPVVVAGERLGAGLAAALMVRLRDLGLAQPRCALLVSALLDLTMQAPSLLLNAGTDPTFDVAELRRRVGHYAGGTPLTDPLLSPLHANLHGLPPIQLLAAGTDPLLDDSLSFAVRAARSGVTVDLRVRPDAAGLRPGTVADMAHFIEACAPSADGSSRTFSG